MKNRALSITAILLILAIGNYSRIVPAENVRMVEFLSIFAIGALSGILLMLMFKPKRN